MKRKNRLLALLLVLCLTLGVFGSAFSVFAADTYKAGAYISDYKIVMHSAPSNDSDKVGELAKDAIVEVLEVRNDDWGRLTFNGISGWVHLTLCTSLAVTLYVARIPESDTAPDFAAIKTNATYGSTDGVMLCAGHVNEDAEVVFNPNFAAQVTAAQTAGLAVGAYFESDAITAGQGEAQGAAVAGMLDNADVTLTLPVCIFYAAGSYTAETAPEIADAVNAFADEIHKKGYRPGVYCDRALAALAARDAKRDTLAFWFVETGVEAVSDMPLDMWEYRNGYANDYYYASRYPMSICIYNYPLILARGCAEGKHQPAEDWTVLKEATCTEKGIRERRCVLCRVILEEEEVEALGHTPKVTDAIPVTCTSDGESSGRVCSVCGVTLVMPQKWPTTGHQWQNEITDDGIVYTCAVCGLELEENEELMVGDVTLDGEITAEDARLALRASVNLQNFLENGVEFAVTDTDVDGLLTAGDARSILRAAVGLDPLGTLTYSVAESKVTKRKAPYDPAVPTELDDKDAAELFIAANKLYLDWLCPAQTGVTFDTEDTVEINGTVYAKITGGDYETVDALTAACGQYFLPDVYEAFVKANYMMLNGSFYGIDGEAEGEAPAKTKVRVVSMEEDTCVIETAVYEADAEEPTLQTVTLKWTDGAWKFALEFPYRIGFADAYEA